MAHPPSVRTLEEHGTRRGFRVGAPCREPRTPDRPRSGRMTPGRSSRRSRSDRPAGTPVVGATDGCRTIAGRRRLARRGRFSFRRQYTRHTRWRFQRWPRCRCQSKHRPNPQRPFFATAALRPSTTGASRCVQSIRGRYHAARDRPTPAHARAIDRRCPHNARKIQSPVPLHHGFPVGTRQCVHDQRPVALAAQEKRHDTPQTVSCQHGARRRLRLPRTQ